MSIPLTETNPSAAHGFWYDRRVFVTGPTGLLGPWLIKRLVDGGANVTVLVRDIPPRSHLYTCGYLPHVAQVFGDLLDRDLLERVLNEHEIDTVFHLGAQAIVGIANRNPLSTLESNIRGSWNLLESARRNPHVQRVLVASSDKAYGNQDQLPYTEDTPLVGRYPYDVSKSCVDLITQSYWHTYRLPVGIVRCGNFFGGGDLNFNRLVPGTIRSVIRGQRPVIRSDGKSIRDYFYVEDGAAAYLLLAEKLASERDLIGQAFNFSNEVQITALEMVQSVLARMNSRLEPDVRNQATNEIPHQYLSARKARERLGWRPLCDLDEGLGRTIAWYAEYFDRQDMVHARAA
ncbi:MAG: GDP-mannose 4,6-dehydratase [bacterium]|nr:GDP-mannose 4,6-dehydratase [bacterium]